MSVSVQNLEEAATVASEFIYSEQQVHTVLQLILRRCQVSTTFPTRLLTFYKKLNTEMRGF